MTTLIQKVNKSSLEAEKAQEQPILEEKQPSDSNSQSNEPDQKPPLHKDSMSTSSLITNTSTENPKIDAQPTADDKSENKVFGFFKQGFEKLTGRAKGPDPAGLQNEIFFGKSSYRDIPNTQENFEQFMYLLQKSGVTKDEDGVYQSELEQQEIQLNQVCLTIAESQSLLKNYFLHQNFGEPGILPVLEGLFDHVLKLTFFLNLFQQEAKEIVQLKDYLAREYEINNDHVLDLKEKFEDILEKSIADAKMRDFFQRKVLNLEQRVNTLNYNLLLKEKVIDYNKQQESFFIKDLQRRREEADDNNGQIKVLFGEVNILF